MLLNEFQAEALKTAIYPQNDDLDCVYTIMGLCSEAGEVAGVWKKYVRGDYSREDALVKLEKELGDVLWYVSAVADSLNMTLEDVADGTLNRLRDRQERGVIQGSGDDR